MKTTSPSTESRAAVAVGTAQAPPGSPQRNDRIGASRLAKPDSSRPSSRMAHRPGFRPRPDSYAPRGLPLLPRPGGRSADQLYYVDDSDEPTPNSLYSAAAAAWSQRQQQQHHAVAAAHQRALMLDRLQVPFRADGGLAGAAAARLSQHLQHPYPHHLDHHQGDNSNRHACASRVHSDDHRCGEFQRILMLEAVIAARREMQVRMALASLAVRATPPGTSRPLGQRYQHHHHHHHDIGDDLMHERLSLGHSLPMFPTTSTRRITSTATALPRYSFQQAGEPLFSPGLDLLHTAATLNRSGERDGVVGPATISPQSKARPCSSVATASAPAAAAQTARDPLPVSADGSVAETRRSDHSASRDPPSAPDSPSSKSPANKATMTTCALAVAAAASSSSSTLSFQGRTYVDTVEDLDILCGRGGKSNHHVGNKKYRHVVGYMKMRYQHCRGKTQKTDLSRLIIDHCEGYGARFLKHDAETGRYYILSNDEARRKTSQALREPKMLKWTTV